MNDAIKKNNSTDTEKSVEKDLVESTAEVQKEKEKQETVVNNQLEALWSTSAHQLAGDHIPEQKTFTQQPQDKKKETTTKKINNAEKEIKEDYTNNRQKDLPTISENHEIATVNNKDINEPKK